MKKVLIFLLLASAVYAQLPWSVTDLRCGNGKIDEFEMCDGGIRDLGHCEALGTILKIDLACDSQHCTCLPRVNKAYCGNNIREGVEMCDGHAEDKCGELGVAINLSLKCDPDSCGCLLNDTAIPVDYDPSVLDALHNQSGRASSCGDKKVERAEDCDPPDTLCTTATKEPGICTSKCKCVTPAELARENEEAVVLAPSETNLSETNRTVMNNSESDNSEVPKDNLTSQVEGPKEPGFFGRAWAWIVGLFS